MKNIKVLINEEIRSSARLTNYNVSDHKDIWFPIYFEIRVINNLQTNFIYPQIRNEKYT